jgi:transposase
MSRYELKPRQRRRLRRQLEEADDARTYRGTPAVLELDPGRSAADLAAMLGVTRQSVHNRAAAYARDHDPAALEDRHRSGRPADLFEQTECVPRSLMPRSPHDLGYPDADRAVPLLQGESGRGSGRRPSDEAVRRAPHRLGYVWERPRYVLDPDPLREKKTPHPAAHPGPAAAQRRPGRGRDRPAAAPAAAGRMVAEGRTGGGPYQRPERAAGGLRGDEPRDRDAAVPSSAEGAGR